MKTFKVILAGAIFLAMSSQTFALFEDVDNTDLYFKGIEYLQDKGVVNGYEDGTFRPENEVNRAEMIKIVTETFGVDEITLAAYANENCFSDVPAGVWYTKYVCYAKAQGWVNGYDDGTFRPEQPINLVEALKIVLQVWSVDYVENLAIWYKGIVDAAAELMYIPFDVASFGENLNRGQMADMIARVDNDKEEKLDEYLGHRATINATYATIQKAISNEDWDVDPNHNALIVTTILTSQTDDGKVFTILDVENEYADHPSIKNIPKTYMYSDEFNTYYYISSAICILYDDCTPSQLAQIDDIITEAWLAAESFSLGEKGQGNGCYYVSDFDFQLTLPPSWGAIHDFTMLDIPYWKNIYGMEDPASYTGRGTVCGGGNGGDGGDIDGAGNGDIIRIQGK